jgi:resuscitation-promoting factor RpfC
MSPRPARPARIASRYEARHAKPGGPAPAVLVGTAVKVVPASLAAGAACSAMVLSGPSASATTTAPAGPAAIPGATAGLEAAARTAVSLARPAATSQRARVSSPATHNVLVGDTLSQISADFCGTAADYTALAAASGIANPDLIYPGESIHLDCHYANATLTASSAPRTERATPAPAGPSSAGTSHAAAAAPAQTVPTASMSAFEACVISRESGGNPQAVNPASGAGGLFQFLPSTWASLGYAASYPGGAQTAPVSVQEAAFATLYAESGTSPWAPYDGC